MRVASSRSPLKSDRTAAESDGAASVSDASEYFRTEIDHVSPYVKCSRLSVGKDAAEMRDALLTPVRRFPWATNVTLYGCLFAGGDFVHQRFSRKERVDWTHTRNVAAVAFGFHGNFNFFWMRFLERRFPGNALRPVLQKLLLDQTLAAPLAISAFYTGVSFMEGREEVLQDWREKFLNTYKTGLMYWPVMQLLNFALVPPLVRTAFTGCCGFIWATFLCFSQQSGDGTITAALDWVRQERSSGTDRAE